MSGSEDVYTLGDEPEVKSLVKSKVVLFVDDEIPNCRQFLRSFFPVKETQIDSAGPLVIQKMAPDGTLVFIARSTGAALKLFQEKISTPEAIDLIFMDRSGPEMNGDAAIRAIRSFEKDRALELIKLGEVLRPCYINYNTTDDSALLPEDLPGLINSGPNLDLKTGRNVKAGLLQGGYQKIIQDFFSQRFSKTTGSLPDLGLAALSLESPLSLTSGLSSATFFAGGSGAASGASTPFRFAAPSVGVGPARVDSPCRLSALRETNSPFAAVLMKGEASPSPAHSSRSASRASSRPGSRSASRPASPAVATDPVRSA